MSNLRILIALSLMSIVLGARAECIVTLEGVAGVFDLTPLQGFTFEATSAAHHYLFEFAVCGTLPDCDGFTTSGVCQSWIGGKASCGNWNESAIQTIPIPAPGVPGVGLVLSGGEDVCIYIFATLLMLRIGHGRPKRTLVSFS